MTTTLPPRYTDLNLQGFIVTHKRNWPQLEGNLAGLPFGVKFFDPADYRGHAFTREMIQLNEAAYGVGMAAPDWTFANFGTIGAGIMGGLLIDGEPASKFSLVGHPCLIDSIHEWTLLVHPQFQNKGLATLTLAMALQTASHKQFHTFLAQTDNVSLNVYLKIPAPLAIEAYGFVHTRPNSLQIRVAIPDAPFDTLIDRQLAPRSLSDYPVARDQLPKAPQFWLKATHHQLWLDLNEALLQGQTFALAGRLEEAESTYLLVDRQA